MNPQPTGLEVEVVAMRIIVIVLAVALFACTKQNPNLCCIDEADCALVGLDQVKGCSDGLLCRGNQCIAEVCTSSAECDADAPYCTQVPDGRCQQTCDDDSQCPGFGESPSQTFCEGGTCVECRTADECDTSAPICDAGTCRACVVNDECLTGVCGTDGLCVAESEIAYVAPGGSASSDCTPTTPCTLSHALSITREFLLLESGGYQTNIPLDVTGRRSLIGSGQRSTIHNTLSGPILRLLNNSDVTIDNLELFGASTGVNGDGNGIEVQMGSVATLRVHRSVFRNNAGAGIQGRNATLLATESVVRDNGTGISLVDANGSVDRCTISGNTASGLDLDAGVYVIRNSFIFRNGTGISIFPSSVGNVIEFNTIADNTKGVACVFSANTPETAFPNNIVARNGQNTTGGAVCIYPGSIITATVDNLKFVSPDAAPFDYHIQAGSTAVGAASMTTLDHDFDGDVRPATGADVGADELP